MRRTVRSLLLAAFVAAAGPALAEMSFRAVTMEGTPLCKPQCPTLILAEGDITESAASDFIDFVRRQLPERGDHLNNVVFVNSPGGVVTASMQLGAVWRRLGTTVVVARPDVSRPGWFASENTAASRIRPARCYSACVYALMGAKKRIIPTGSRVGVHQAHKVELMRDPAGGSIRELTGSNETGPTLKAYAKMMGVSPGLIDLAQNTPPQDFHYLTADEIRRFRLANSRF